MVLGASGRGAARRKESWIPLLFFLLIASGAGALWWAGEGSERQWRDAEMRVLASQVRARIESWMDVRVAAIEHIALHWHRDLADDPGAYRIEAQTVIEALPGLQAINWVDTEGVIRLVHPHDGNGPALGSNLWQHPEASVSEALARASQLDQATRSGMIRLLQGGTGIACYRRVRDGNGRPAGFLNVVFRLDELDKAWLTEGKLAEHFYVELRDGDGSTAIGESIPDDYEGPRHAESVRIVDRTWGLIVAPRRPLDQAFHSLANEVFLLAVVLLAAGVAWLAWRQLERYRRLRHRENAARELLSWSAELQAVDSYQELLEAAGHAVKRFVGADTVWIYERDAEEAGRWSLVAVGGAESARVRVRHAQPASFNPRLEKSEPGGGVISLLTAQEDAHPSQGRSVALHVPVRLVDGKLALLGAGFLDEDQLSGEELGDLGEIAGHLVLALTRVRVAFERRVADDERRRLERQLQQGQKLESLGLLAGGVAHDFNNLLVGILGNADLALAELDAETSGARRVADVVASARGASELCEQMLAFTGEAARDPAPLDLSALAGDVVRLLRPKLPAASELEMELESPFPAVMADAIHVGQLVMNLLTNAMDALEGERGTIRVRTLVESCRSETFAGCPVGEDAIDGSYAVLEVTDTGCGMDRPTRERMFDPFFTTKVSGRGLGMAAVLGTVKAHEGAISVRSTPGRGTSIRLFLPLASAPVPAKKKEPVPSGAWTGKGTALVVDDEEPVRAVARRMLERLGLEVLVAADGEEALAVHGQAGASIDIVVLDLSMPGLGGAEVLAALRERDPELPVVLTSGYPAREPAVAAALDKAQGFLRKPYQLMEARALLKPLLEARTKARLERQN